MVRLTKFLILASGLAATAFSLERARINSPVNVHLTSLKSVAKPELHHSSPTFLTAGVPSQSNAELLLAIACIPGLGLVKAGFYIQLCTGYMGCLDVHNLKRFGLDRKTFLVPESLSWETALGKANMYLETIEKCGGSEYLWDSWCDYIAALYPKKFKNGEHVSQCHVDYLISRKD